jgi:hypothetical protein
MASGLVLQANTGVRDTDGLKPHFSLLPPHDIPVQPCTFQMFELFSGLSAILDFLHSNYSKQKQFTESVSCAIPTQAIAARARWQAILGRLRPAFITLNDVVHFPVSIWSFAPTAILKLDWVAAKMAVPTCLVVDFPQILFVHNRLSSAAHGL